MITWFDALLVTLWAAITVVGMRRGLAGGVWALLALLGVLLSNGSPWPLLAPLLAAGLGFAAAWGAQRLFWGLPTRGWHLAVGALGGFAVGFFVVCALALSFPVKVLGSQGSYPSSDLPAPLYYAAFNSLIVQDLTGAWSSGPLVKRLVLPDQRR